MNMSYCRYRNTLIDLGDCQEAINTDENDLSPEEKQARRQLILMCHEIAQDTQDEWKEMLETLTKQHTP